MDDFWPRAILHVDMDAFYASVEQHDNPELRGKPVIVGGSAEGRGVVSAASYEARAYGVHSAMPTSKAHRLCPHGIFLRVRMWRYQEVSEQVHAVFAEFTPDIQPISVDEAFLDISGCQRLFGSPAEIARKLKDAVKARTGLTASVGVGPNRFVAKIASDIEKPDGLVLIRREEVLDRLAPLPVNRIWGVGRVTGLKMEKLGINTIADLRQWPQHTLVEHFGNTGASLYNLARGEDHSEVEEGEVEKSVSNETTFSRDLFDTGELEHALLALSDKVGSRLRSKGFTGRTIQLKVKYGDFTSITRRVTLPCPTCVGSEIYSVAVKLLHARTEAGSRSIRLIGVGVSGLYEGNIRQATLFSPVDTSSQEKSEKAERAVDRIREKLGPDFIGRGSLMLDEDEDDED
ncbi:MAG: DNA polymerase IV [Planctomycetes bacterium]|nr:DNA polymerase IV [Planctomycetota bacterium]